MDNLSHNSTLYQSPSIADIEINIQETEQEQQEFVNPSREGHNENLAEILPQTTLNRLSARLIELIEEDIESRRQWEEALAEGLKLLGIKYEDRNYPFDNASGVYGPSMMEGFVNFTSVAVAELLPLEGPVKQYIVGEVTDELQDRADRIESFFNNFLLKDCKEYYSDTKKMLSWVYTSGSIIRKSYFDEYLERPTVKFILPQDFIVNYGTTDLETCSRMTEVINITKEEVLRNQRTGIFIDTNLFPDDSEDGSIIKKTHDNLEGVTKPANHHNNGDYTFYESHVSFNDFEISESVDDFSESIYRPYIVKIHKDSKKIVSIYRNWKEGDEKCIRTNYYTKFGFITSLGFYDWGAVHLIGGLSLASTATLRQIIDGQTLANFPGGFRVKGMPLQNNNIPIGPCEFPEIETGGLPIQQAIMTMPYKEPSPQVNIVRNELDMSASRIMGSANMQIPEFQTNAPVGTTLALLDVLHLVQSTVLRGLRDSMSREFEILYRLFSETISQEPYEFSHDGGKSYISRQDFIDDISIIPVADPHVTTKIQRIIRSQYLQDLCLKFPGLYDAYEVNKIALKEAKFTDSQIDKILVNQEEVIPLDPVTENQNLIMGKAAKASIEQDHQSHLTVHDFMSQDSSLAPNVLAATASHIAEHKALQFQIQIQQLTGIQLPPDPSQVPLEVQNQIAMLAAQALQQQQKAQQEAQPPLLDPAAVMLEKVKVEEKGVEQRDVASEREAQVKAFEAQLDYDAKMKALELKEEELRLKAQAG